MIRPGSALTKSKQQPYQQQSYAQNLPQHKVKFNKQFIYFQQHKLPTLEDYVKNRDWIGATVYLEYTKGITISTETNMWLAYVYFHSGEYRKAINIYDEVMKRADYNKNVHIFKACCLYALCNYDESKRECSKGPETPLSIRLLFHISHKKNDEKNLMTYHHKIQDNTEDQLCLAAIHYLRSHYEEATEIYKKLLLENREFLAINVYVALCYYKLDYYDVSLEILQYYLKENPNSVIAMNLKACNQYQLYNGKAAEAELKELAKKYQGGNIFNDFDLLRHNLVVFRNGENALQVLLPLIEFFPEARLNLVIYYLKNDEIQEAYNLIKDLEPQVPREYIIKGVVFAIAGQKTESKDDLKVAQQLFQLVGGSPSECDTIPGRQCMASCFFLLKQFEDVLIYLRSVKNFFENDDDFNWNYGIACASIGEYKEAMDALSKIVNEKYKNEDTYLRWMTRVYIMNKKPEIAWNIYVNLETSNESITLLQLIANDCYRMGQFYYSAKAFDILKRFDNEREYDQAYKGAVVGVFQMVVAKKESPEKLMEVLTTMKQNTASDPQVEYILKVVRKWGKDLNFQI